MNMDAMFLERLLVGISVIPDGSGEQNMGRVFHSVPLRAPLAALRGQPYQISFRSGQGSGLWQS